MEKKYVKSKNRRPVGGRGGHSWEGKNDEIIGTITVDTIDGRFELRSDIKVTAKGQPARPRLNIDFGRCERGGACEERGTPQKHTASD